MSEIEAGTAAWIEAATGTTLLRSEALMGGMSSRVHRCWMADGSDLVVRHITDMEWLKREPDLIDRERRALLLLAEAGFRSPAHVASDPSTGRLLMARRPGVVVSSAAGLRPRVKALADAAAAFHRVPLPPDHGLPSWHSWAPVDLRPPRWGDTGMWRAAIDAYRSFPPPKPVTTSLLHRDFHPLNVLWADLEVSGVVDWVNACVGDPHAELGHCRWNLAVLVDLPAADEFLERYRQATDLRDYDPWWDLATSIGLLPGPPGTAGWRVVGRTDLTETRVRGATEQFLRAALERMDEEHGPGRVR